MTSKIISGGKSGGIPRGLKKQAVMADESRVLASVIKNENGEQSFRRDLTLISPPYDIAALRDVVDNSNILNQCIEAYATNVAGFGLDLRYKMDDSNENEETKAEWDVLTELLNELSFERPPKEIIQEVIRQVEECGNGYFEVIRNGVGHVVGFDSIKPEFMTVTKQNVVTNDQGQQIKVRYFNYRDNSDDSNVNSGTWFKTYGDTTPLDTNGSIGNGTATEVIHIKIGDFQSPYGVPRWIGPLIKIIGNRKADELNYRYFVQGRHIPLAIMLENAQLTQASEATLKSYADSIGGEENQHKFILLESEKVSPGEEAVGYGEDKSKPSIRVEHLADVLQKDALFLEYDENVTQAVLGAFRLPPIYVAKTTDYNRNTAETAKELTEEQVFQPLRESYAWRINSLFKEYDLKYVEVYLKAPKIKNMDDVTKFIQVANSAGAVAPNDLRGPLSDVLGLPLDNFEGEEYNLPTKQSNAQNGLNSDGVNLSKAYGTETGADIAAGIRQIMRRARDE